MKHNRCFRLDRLFFRYLKGTKLEKMNLAEFASILDQKRIINLIITENGLKYEQIKNISRENMLKIIKNEVIL